MIERLGGVVLAMWLSLPALAGAAPADFPKPPGLVPAVEFWKKVFAEYSENQVVIHDDAYLDKIYTVIDLGPLITRYRCSVPTCGIWIVVLGWMFNTGTPATLTLSVDPFELKV